MAKTINKANFQRRNRQHDSKQSIRENVSAPTADGDIRYTPHRRNERYAVRPAHICPLAAYSPATDNGRKRGLDNHYRAETLGGTLQTAQPGQHHSQTPADNPVHRRTRLSVLSIEDMKEEGSKQQERRPNGTKDTGERANVIPLSPVFPAVRRQRTCDALLNRLNGFEIPGPIRSLVVFDRSCRNFQHTGFVHERKMCHIAERTIQLRQGGRGTLAADDRLKTGPIKEIDMPSRIEVFNRRRQIQCFKRSIPERAAPNRGKPFGQYQLGKLTIGKGLIPYLPKLRRQGKGGYLTTVECPPSQSPALHPAASAK